MLRRPGADEEDEFRRAHRATTSLLIAHGQLGLDRVLVTCDDDNVGSIRSIEKNGGVLENVVSGPDPGKAMRRSWIEKPRQRQT